MPLNFRSRNAKQLKLNFGDPVKSGRDAKDSWIRMLMQITSISEAKAIAIVQAFPTVKSLYYLCRDDPYAEETIANIPIISIARQTRLGPAAAKIIKYLLMSNDPDANAR